MTAPQLLVSGFSIPVAPDGAKRDYLDGVDRARAFDLTYRASATGNPKRDWTFRTPPISRASADMYEVILRTVAAQNCYGDLLQGVENLLLRSEELNNAAWVKSNATVDSDVINAPNGTLTGDKLKETAVNTVHTASQAVTGLATNTIYAYSLSLYPAERNWTRVAITGKDGVTRYVYFDLTAGVAGSSAGTSGYGIERPSSAGGWWRAWVAATIGTGGSTPEVQIGIATADGTNSYLGTAGSGVYVWGEQLELGSVPSAYTKTVAAAISPNNVSCCTEILDWTAVQTPQGHRVVLEFALHEV